MKVAMEKTWQVFSSNLLMFNQLFYKKDTKTCLWLAKFVCFFSLFFTTSIYPIFAARPVVCTRDLNSWKKLLHKHCSCFFKNREFTFRCSRYFLLIGHQIQPHVLRALIKHFSFYLMKQVLIQFHPSRPSYSSPSSPCLCFQ